MKRIHIIGVALVAMFAFSVVVASSASALEALWLINGQDIPTGQSWNANQNPVAGSPLLLEDMKAGVDVLCEGSGLVWLLPGGKDLQAIASCVKPVVDAGTCESPKVEAINLGWNTQLELMETSGIWLDAITGSTVAGVKPGWLVECTVPLIGKINDECTTNNGTVILTNNESTGIVEGEFPEAPESKSEQANCTVGGAEEGLVVGKFTTEALTPGGVRVPLTLSLD
jgi:hypothetical protein